MINRNAINTSLLQLCQAFLQKYNYLHRDEGMMGTPASPQHINQAVLQFQEMYNIPTTGW